MRCDEAATARARTISLHRAHDVTRSLCACADVMRVRFTMMSCQSHCPSYSHCSYCRSYSLCVDAELRPQTVTSTRQLRNWRLACIKVSVWAGSKHRSVVVRRIITVVVPVYDEAKLTSTVRSDTDLFGNMVQDSPASLSASSTKKSRIVW